jgi:Tfp pilus tip-associated adhesin PilY1
MPKIRNIKPALIMHRVKAFTLVLLLLLVTGAQGEPVTKNEVEDLNIIISQIVGGEPNVLIITDYSGSMLRGWAGTQAGNWDEDTDGGVIDDCEELYSTGSTEGRRMAAHCIENVAGLSVCGSRHGGGSGIVSNQEELLDFVNCIQNPPGGGSAALTNTQINTVYDQICGNNNGTLTETISDCTGNERAEAAAAMDAWAGFAQCASVHCNASGTGNTRACDTSTEYNNFKSCVQTVQAITKNKTQNCSNSGMENCTGAPQFGSSRVDMLHSVLFDFLDADDSLAEKMCDDPSMLFNGVSGSITCRDYMYTPFRNVRRIAREETTGSPRLLPITNGTDTKLIDELTIDDAEELGVRLRALQYSGAGRWSSCTSSSTFRLLDKPFSEPGKNIRNTWDFFRKERASGGTPLAWVLGFDDNSGSTTSGGNTIINDAIFAFNNELKTDPAISCRPQFVIVITDGEDTCAGQTSGPSGSGQTSGSLTTNANRRSSIQAVSNLRTHYSRNVIRGHPKEVLVFVIGVGIKNPEARRTLNAMALAGGTHTEGIIQHTGPNGDEIISSVNINSPDIFPQGSEFEVYRDLARARYIDTSPGFAQLQGCKNNSTERRESGQCSFQNVNIFDNNFFNTGAPFNDTDKRLDNFAFFVDSAEELSAALKDIAGTINVYSTSGVSPTAPQSSTAVALRDRIFMSILTPITPERLWQGRLALFGFVDVPGNAGSKEVIRKPPAGSNLGSESVVNGLAVFDDDGTLNNNAKQFFWEAGKKLTERNIVDSPRNLLTVRAPDLIPEDGVSDPPFSGSDYLITANSILYKGPLVLFDDPANPLGPGQFGISNADVTDPIPEYCVPTGGSSTQCQGSSGVVSCSDVTTNACRTCVKECMRDRIVDFLVGHTDIATVLDPMGQPSLGQSPSQTDGADPFTSMGYNCPDPEDRNNDGNFGSLEACSVRLGDIFHSNPVVVGSPSPLFFDAGYQSFAVKFRDRSAVVYVGANDGFIHAFHAGEFKDPNAEGAGPDEKTNPFTLETEIFPFFDEGTGYELFGVTIPTFLADSLATPTSQASSPAEMIFGSPLPPDYRTGDFKTFVLDNFTQRSFADGSPIIGDVFIDGSPNGISLADESPEECAESVSTADGDIDVCGREWHTVLLAGAHNGGGAYIALDVTNPACGENCGTTDTLDEHIKSGGETLEYPKHMWTLFDRDFGNTWSTPSMGRIRLKVTEDDDSKIVDRWVMFVGGGLDPTDTDPSDGVSFGNAFVVVDISTGKEIFKFHPTNSIPSGGSTMSNVGDMLCDVPSRVASVDINSDGYTDLAYFGDTCGRMWRFDVSMPIDVSGSIAESGPSGNLSIVAEAWTGQVAFCANTDAECFDAGNSPAVPSENLEPIFFAPTIVLDDLGRRHVIFVTGDRRDPSSALKSGKLYNFIDDYIPAFLAGGTATGGQTIKTASYLISAGQVIEIGAQSGVEDQFVSSSGNNFQSDQGEFIVVFPSNLGEEEFGEKGFGVPVVINRVLIFTTYAPEIESEDPCSGGTGFGRIFALDFITGAAALARIPGVTESDILKGSDAQRSLAAGVTVAEGMPTPAQLTFGARGSVLMSVAFTGGPVAGGSQFIIWELPPLPTRTQTLFWEEIL